MLILTFLACLTNDDVNARLDRDGDGFDGVENAGDDCNDDDANMDDGAPPPTSVLTAPGQRLGGLVAVVDGGERALVMTGIASSSTNWYTLIFGAQ